MWSKNEIVKNKNDKKVEFNWKLLGQNHELSITIETHKLNPNMNFGLHYNAFQFHYECRKHHFKGTMKWYYKDSNILKMCLEEGKESYGGKRLQ